MPIITSDTVQKDSGDGVDDPCGPYAAELYSDTGGLTQFGAFVEILPPGHAPPSNTGTKAKMKWSICSRARSCCTKATPSHLFT
jgi:hypothetical protein